MKEKKNEGGNYTISLLGFNHGFMIHRTLLSKSQFFTSFSMTMLTLQRVNIALQVKLHKETFKVSRNISIEHSHFDYRVQMLTVFKKHLCFPITIPQFRKCELDAQIPASAAIDFSRGGQRPTSVSVCERQ